jgi:microcystin-dependent protein
MSTQFVGEIRMFGGTFAPSGWLMCDGSSLPIEEFETLFNLIGTTYGGDGQTTFNVPDLRGRWPMHLGAGLNLGQTGGVESVMLTPNQLPTHSHPMTASSAATSTSPAGTTPAVSSLTQYAAAGSVSTADELLPTVIGSAGGSQPHENRSPYLGMTMIIAWSGIFPSS